jgi:hypothetical protein
MADRHAVGADSRQPGRALHDHGEQLGPIAVSRTAKTTKNALESNGSIDRARVQCPCR